MDIKTLQVEIIDYLNSTPTYKIAGRNYLNKSVWLKDLFNIKDLVEFKRSTFYFIHKIKNTNLSFEIWSFTNIFSNYQMNTVVGLQSKNLTTFKILGIYNFIDKKWYVYNKD